jgi:hypothetical protein
MPDSGAEPMSAPSATLPPGTSGRLCRNGVVRPERGCRLLRIGWRPTRAFVGSYKGHPVGGGDPRMLRPRAPSVETRAGKPAAAPCSTSDHTFAHAWEAECGYGDRLF